METKIKIGMRWNEPHRKYLMEMDKTGYFVFDFWDCTTLNKVFTKLDKKKVSMYELTVKQIDDDF